jgi:hypothetical protein
MLPTLPQGPPLPKIQNLNALVAFRLCILGRGWLWGKVGRVYNLDDFKDIPDFKAVKNNTKARINGQQVNILAF